MKLTKTVATVALMLWVGVAQGGIIFSTNVNQVIPDGTPIGVYSTIRVSGLDPVITSISVDITVSGGYNGDLYAYLVHGSDFAVLLNRVGRDESNPFGFSDSGFTIRFVTDSAGGSAEDIHTSGNRSNPLTGTWLVDGRNVDPASVLSRDLRTALLDSFLGKNPNGDWTIVFFDMAGGFQSTFVGWGLEIDAVPEPVTMGLGVFGLLVGLVNLGRVRRWLRF